MPDLALGTGRVGDLSTPTLPPDGVLPPARRVLLPPQDQTPRAPDHRTFPVDEEEDAWCYAVTVVPSRHFGAFVEKTLRCNPAARRAIDSVCHAGGFTQEW